MPSTHHCTSHHLHTVINGNSSKEAFPSSVADKTWCHSRKLNCQFPRHSLALQTALSLNYFKTKLYTPCPPLTISLSTLSASHGTYIAYISLKQTKNPTKPNHTKTTHHKPVRTPHQRIYKRNNDQSQKAQPELLVNINPIRFKAGSLLHPEKHINTDKNKATLTFLISANSTRGTLQLQAFTFKANLLFSKRSHNVMLPSNHSMCISKILQKRVFLQQMIGKISRHLTRQPP